MWTCNDYFNVFFDCFWKRLDHIKYMIHMIICELFNTDIRYQIIRCQDRHGPSQCWRCATSGMRCSQVDC